MAGCAVITTLAVAGEMHPAALVTVKLYVPIARPVVVVVLPVPVIAPGLIVQLPAGRPFNTTDPVDKVQVGCVMVPTIGAAGVAGCAVITTLAVAGEMHPAAFVTVKLYVPAARPVIVLVLPVPAIAPGLIVQLPEGRPFNTTDPVDKVQVGCVMVPTIGAAGVAGCAFTVTLIATEIHPAKFLAVRLYVPGATSVNTPPDE